MKRLFEFVGLHNLELSFLFVFVNVENSIEIRVVLAMEIVGTSWLYVFLDIFTIP